MCQCACLLLVPLSGLWPGCMQPQQSDWRARVETLASALRAEDLDAILAAVADAKQSLGDRAGVPESTDVYRDVPPTARMLLPHEASTAFATSIDRLEAMRWWHIGVDPTRLTAPLRGPASVITGNVAITRGGLEGADRCLAMAKEAADFLLWAQDQAGAGLFPFPAARGTSKARAMQVGTRFLERAEKSNQLEKVVHNGWAIEDLGDGGLQFDNGECGVAILQLYSVTGESRYLESARRAARWAMSRPLCPNWNYNAFSVDLLACFALVTGENEYRDAALRKARLGVIPGQLTEGKYAGRWLDPHNARPPYHYIMMRSLARLAAALPNNHPDRGEIVAALRLGLETRNKEIIERGVMNKDDAVEALLLVTEVFKNDPEFLLKTRSVEALDTLLRLVSEESRHGKLPLSPGPWGLALERMALAPMASTAGPEE